MEIFIQNIREIKDFDSVISDMPKDRYHKCLAYRKQEDKLACIAGYQLIREHIGSGELLSSEYGKPFIKNAPYFNLSHSGDYVILAVNDTAIGCDIEKIVDIDVKSIANHSFHKKEVEFLESVNYDLRAFYKIWTIKESYVKMLGLGLSKDFKSFYIDLATLTINEAPKTKITIDENLQDYIIATAF